MQIKKEDCRILLSGVPKEFKVIAFGKFINAGYDFYFAFLAPKESFSNSEKKIEGVKYAEGLIGAFNLLDNEVETCSKEGGGYDFLVKAVFPKQNFKLFPDSRKSTMRNEHLVELISIELI